MGEIRFFAFKKRGLNKALHKEGKNNTTTERSKAKTPPNFLGIDRKIAYANRKYHSGTIWAGVDKEFAKIKFSGSPSKKGKRKTKTSKSKTQNKK